MIQLRNAIVKSIVLKQATNSASAPLKLIGKHYKVLNLLKGVTAAEIH